MTSYLAVPNNKGKTSSVVVTVQVVGAEPSRGALHQRRGGRRRPAAPVRRDVWADTRSAGAGWGWSGTSVRGARGPDRALVPSGGAEDGRRAPRPSVLHVYVS